MKRHLAVVAAILLLACAAYGRDGVNSETIRLRYLAPDNVFETLKARQGIDQLTLNYSDNSVTVRGDAKAVTKFKADLRLADVPITVYWVKMRLVRFHVDASGKQSEKVAMAPTISTVANVLASCSQRQNKSGHTVFVTVSQNTDKTVTVNTEIRELGDDGEIVSSGQNTRIVKPGETVRTVGMTDAKDRDVRKAVHLGEIANNVGEYSSYYLDVEVVQRPAGK